MNLIIHRWGMNGQYVCGQVSGAASRSGLLVTCPKCLDLSKTLSKEEAVRQIERAASSRYQRKKKPCDTTS